MFLSRPGLLFRKAYFSAQGLSRRHATGLLHVERLEDRTVPSLVVPAYDSYPSARAQLYLDFDGHTELRWENSNGVFRNVQTPAFDLDNDPTTYNDEERAAIHEVWARVAEDYAPFRINVTTVEPADFPNKVALRVAIGGSGTDWYGRDVSGTSDRGSFTNDAVNVVYVFARSIVQWRPATYRAALATTASHEAGHAFGLRHQNVYDLRTGELLEEYNPGTAEWTPIMGANLSADRTTWHNGPVDVQYSQLLRRWMPIIQEDMTVLASDANGFGYRSDDHGDSTRTATSLLPTREGQVAGRGVIGRATDADYFVFIATGEVRLTVAPALLGANLDAQLELRDTLNRLVASADPDNSLEATLRVNGLVGNYYAVVRSHGGHGDVGQYSISGTIGQLLRPFGAAAPGEAEPRDGQRQPVASDAAWAVAVMGPAQALGLGVPAPSWATLAAQQTHSPGVPDVQVEDLQSAEFIPSPEDGLTSVLGGQPVLPAATEGWDLGVLDQAFLSPTGWPGAARTAEH